MNIKVDTNKFNIVRKMKFIQIFLVYVLLLLPYNILQATTISSSTTNETCKTSDDGTITISITSGAGNYTYRVWDNDPIWGGGVLLYSYGPTTEN